jgi:hypothetical protein
MMVLRYYCWRKCVSLSRDVLVHGVNLAGGSGPSAGGGGLFSGLRVARGRSR